MTKENETLLQNAPILEEVAEEVQNNPLDDPSFPRLSLALFIDMESEKAKKEEVQKRKAREQVERDKRAREEEYERWSREVGAMMEEDYRWEDNLAWEEYKYQEGLKEPDCYYNQRGNRVFMLPRVASALESTDQWNNQWDDASQTWHVDENAGKYVGDDYFYFTEDDSYSNE